jgi:hypothetical protein
MVIAIARTIPKTNAGGFGAMVSLLAWARHRFLTERRERTASKAYVPGNTGSPTTADGDAMRHGLVSVQMPAQFLNCAFTQEIGIALAGLGKFDDAFGDDSVGEIVYEP